MKSRTARSTEAYEHAGGMVLWLGDVPDHPAVTLAGRRSAPVADEPVLGIGRVPVSEPPALDEDLRPWLLGRLDEPTDPPRLGETVASRLLGDRRGGTDVVSVDDVPGVRDSFENWYARWRAWAEQEELNRRVRDTYQRLFSAYQTATGNPESFELVLGVGCLGWHPDGHEPVKRHVVTVPVTIRFEDETGRLFVELAHTSRSAEVELDMLDPGLTLALSSRLDEVRKRVESFDAHPLCRDELASHIRSIVHSLNAEGVYVDDDAPPPAGRVATASFAPAVILRKRSQHGLLEIFRTIVAQLENDREVQEGLLPLIDPDFRPRLDAERADGAAVTVDDEVFLPLPVNEVQQRIIRQVDTNAQIVVQGPPGTGKTHTAVALLCHLLAQGKRVLVTAHTDRALNEVRAKLPADVKPLAVAVMGSSREDMADLKVAVERIASAADEFDEVYASRTIEECLAKIDELRRRRALLYHQLVDAREEEVLQHEHQDVRGTLASIAYEHRERAATHGWLTNYADVSADSRTPLDDVEIQEWHRYLTDALLAEDEPEARLRLVDISQIPHPDEFAELVGRESAALEKDRSYGPQHEHPAFEAIRGLETGERTELRNRLHSLAEQADALSRNREGWMREALPDVLAGRGSIWQGRANQVKDLLARAEPLVDSLGYQAEVSVTGADLGPLVSLARKLKAHLEAGGKLRVGPDGMPKVGAFSPRPVKAAQPLFERVRVDGMPPGTVERLDAFLVWEEASRLLRALDRAWPAGVRIPDEDTVHERLQWHRTELDQLERLLDLATRLGTETDRLRALQLPLPDWSDIGSVRDYAKVVDAAAAADALAEARAPLARLEELAAQTAAWHDAAPAVKRLHVAISDRDPNGYVEAHRRLRRLREVVEAVGRRDELGARLRAAAPRLHDALVADPHDDQWPARLATFAEAWRWAAVGAWLHRRDSVDVNALQAEVQSVEQEIRRQVEKLAVTRAWRHAVSPDRLTGSARSDLRHYAYLVRRLGKGTGKYASQQRAEIRRAMDRCRPAVPVWIMPIYRIAEQLHIRPGMFDVVIVDEASQAGAEAVFLQYLAPRIVVIGDDKQVSPAAVGVDEQQLRDLAEQVLPDDPRRSSWQDPKCSFFDVARQYFGCDLVLKEHRRCVPEIIGFSNEIAYEPDGIRLIPVRQHGADRLEPIKPVFVPEGYTRGTTNRINPPEAEAVVDQIEKCLADSRYDGLTFGVISLMGKAQALEIERRLLERIPPEEWRARDLRCGDAADFQGAERDVIFLSMVAAPEPDKRMGVLSRDLYVQRYNVAASRARDQMWLFHSVRLTDLGHPEDMRTRLLEYCYRVADRRRPEVDGALESVVPEDRLVEPFDSLFEQRVCNRLLDRGYTVVPQYPVAGYRIDLVVVGARARLAVECDGDAWHGPERYEADLARQRDLERCGWRFFRIRESRFYADQTAVLEELRSTLDEMEIYPRGWRPPFDGPEADDPSSRRRDPSPPTADVDRDHIGREDEAPIHEPSAPEGDETVEVVRMADQPEASDSAKRTRPAQLTRSQERPQRRSVVKVVEHATPVGERTERVARFTPAPYEEFQGELVPVDEATQLQLIYGLVSIVEVEGPVLGLRLHSAYVAASGGQRVGKQIASTLNRALVRARRVGRLVADDPLKERGERNLTYRLPNQVEVRVRQLGPRTLEEVPPLELATLLDRIEAEGDASDLDQLYRIALHRLGRRNLTSNARARFNYVHARLRGFRR